MRTEQVTYMDQLDARARSWILRSSSVNDKTEIVFHPAVDLASKFIQGHAVRGETEHHFTS